MLKFGCSGFSNLLDESTKDWGFLLSEGVYVYKYIDIFMYTQIFTYVYTSYPMETAAEIRCSFLDVGLYHCPISFLEINHPFEMAQEFMVAKIFLALFFSVLLTSNFFLQCPPSIFRLNRGIDKNPCSDLLLGSGFTLV